MVHVYNAYRCCNTSVFLFSTLLEETWEGILCPGIRNVAKRSAYDDKGAEEAKSKKQGSVHWTLAFGTDHCYSMPYIRHAELDSRLEGDLLAIPKAMHHQMRIDHDDLVR